MAMQFGPTEGNEEDALVSAINTTPLVDVMLVLLIIFLITVPVVTHTVPVALPKDRNLPSNVKPHDVVISVDHAGKVYWGNQPTPDLPTLQRRLDAAAILQPQPSVQIYGDQTARYAAIGKVVMAVERAGIVKVGFITQPPANNP